MKLNMEEEVKYTELLDFLHFDEADTNDSYSDIVVADFKYEHATSEIYRILNQKGLTLENVSDNLTTLMAMQMLRYVIDTLKQSKKGSNRYDASLNWLNQRSKEVVFLTPNEVFDTLNIERDVLENLRDFAKELQEEYDRKHA